MKNFFKRFKSYGFWVSLSAALVLLINCLGRIFGFSIENKLIDDLVMSIAGFLAVLGIVSMKGSSNENEQSETDVNKEEKPQTDNDCVNENEKPQTDNSCVNENEQTKKGEDFVNENEDKNKDEKEN